MNTLKEVKEDLREQISSLKDAVYNLRHENSGVDRFSGAHTMTGKYEMRREIEIQLETTRRIYKMLTKVKKLR